MFHALVLTMAAGSACTGSGAPEQARKGDESLDVGTQSVPLLRSDAPIDFVAQQFRISDARAMSNGITQLVTMRDRPDVVALVDAAWRMDRRSHPDFNWTSLETLTVRLAIAGVLGQWATDKTAFRSFATGQINSSDPMTRLDAVIALAAIGDPADTALFERLARGADESVATGALGALQIMGTPESLHVLEAAASDPALPAARQQLAKSMLALPRPPK
jgi:hypothetical protein